MTDHDTTPGAPETEACWTRGADGEGNPNCTFSEDHEERHSDSSHLGLVIPSASQAEARHEELVELLADHTCRLDPTNDRTWTCRCGLSGNLKLNGSHRDHLADVLATRDAAQRAAGAETALREAAEALFNSIPNTVHPFAAWLRERADRIGGGS